MAPIKRPVQTKDKLRLVSHTSKAITKSSKLAKQRQLKKQLLKNKTAIIALNNSKDKQNINGGKVINMGHLNLPDNSKNNTNINESIEPEANGKELPSEVHQNVRKKPELVYSHCDLTDFVSNSSIKHLFPFVSVTQGTMELLEKFINAIDQMENVQLNELSDLCQLGIVMYTYESLEAHCMMRRIQLVDTVFELTVDLPQESRELIGHEICERFVIGTARDRMHRVIVMQKSLLVLLNKQENAIQDIAMAALLATIAKISGMTAIKEDTNILQSAFKMIKLVDWMQLITDCKYEDMFVLARSLSLMIKSQRKRAASNKCDMKLDKDIHKIFTDVLCAMRAFDSNPPLAVQVGRFIASCILED